MSPRRAAALAGSAALAAGSCAVVTGGAEKDEVEAERERAADEAAREEEAFAAATAPSIVVEPEGFGRGAAAITADVACEAAVIAAIAAIVTGAVHLARWRPSALAIVLSLLALALGALAFLNSAT